MSQTYDYQKKLNGPKFLAEVAADPLIIVGATSVSFVGDIYYVTFKAALSSAEKTELDALVAAHDPSELPEQTISFVNAVGNTDLDEYDLTFRFQGWDWEIPANSQGDETIHVYENLDIVKPYPLLVLGGFVTPSAAMIGDEVSFIINPGGVVGYLTEAAAQGDTHIHVDATAARDYIWRGYNVGLMDDQENLFEAGECVSKAGNVINFETPLDKAYPAYTPVQCEFRLIPKWFRFDTERRIDVDGGTRWAKIGANITSTLLYRNVTKTAKRFTFTWKYYI